MTASHDSLSPLSTLRQLTQATFGSDVGCAAVLPAASGSTDPLVRSIPASGPTGSASSKSHTPFDVPASVPASLAEADRIGIAARIRSEYALLPNLPPSIITAQQAAGRRKKHAAPVEAAPTRTENSAMIDAAAEKTARDGHDRGGNGSSSALVVRKPAMGSAGRSSSALLRSDGVQKRPDWHPPWVLSRVMAGHAGWVRALAFEPANTWFASGAGDRTIKIWDLASGRLRLTLTGHISTVRGLAVSDRHPYLFSAGEDKKVKCWDLETNTVIRDYHGHLSAVYSLALHPTLDVLVTAGRDGVARVWDIRTRAAVHVLSGHSSTIASVKTQPTDPQVITGSFDNTVRLWDLAAGKTMGVLTHHKKSVRSLACHPSEYSFASASTGSVKQWRGTDGGLLGSLDQHGAVINTLSINQDGVMFSGGDDGSAVFWDWQTGHPFQQIDRVAPQPGSLDAEAGIMTSQFDLTGLRLLTGEADKTIKVWKMDENATEESHPVVWKPTLGRRRF